MIETPAFKGNKSVRSCEPPSGKMPIEPPSVSFWYTAEYMLDWSTCGRTCGGEGSPFRMSQKTAHVGDAQKGRSSPP